ncbi:MAG: hypothetical protein QG651_1012 [Pseudomonadota bacterium]|jgi:cobalamin biosynthesis Co2+ chelatase CbiK|nr:hypothetical protein [Pseudomonadota bacterium]HCY38458.1 hypothetical protein [Neisseriales bacterium]
MQKNNQTTALILVHHGGKLTPEVINGYTSLKTSVVNHFARQNLFQIYDAFLNKRYINNSEELITLDLESLLERLFQLGMQQVFIQPSLLVPGQQYQKLIELVTVWQDKFTDIRVGNALLSDLISCQKLAGMMNNYFGKYPEVENILVAHGGVNHGNRWLEVFSFELKRLNSCFHLVELSRDEFANLESFSEHLQLKINQLTTNFPIKIISFMLILGHHFYNDIVSSCQKIQVNTAIEIFPQSLSELEFIHQFVIDKICQLLSAKNNLNLLTQSK